MSQAQVLATVDALLKHATKGFKAKLTALAVGNPIPILTDIRWVPWALAGTMQAATTVNVMLRPGEWRQNPKNDGRPHRDAFADFEIGYETFDADPTHIQENVILAMTALAQVIDELVLYSEQNGGTIADIEDPVVFVPGQFTVPTSNGFLARARVLERSSQ